VKCITFKLRDEKEIGIPIGRHVKIGFIGNDKRVYAKPYTPCSPLNKTGSFDIIFKVYEGGKVSTHLSQRVVGDKVLIKGPIGNFDYEKNKWYSIGLIAGGTGITPIYQLIQSILLSKEDETNIYLIFCNSTNEDLLLEQELDKLAEEYPNSLHIKYVISRPHENWKKGTGGRINKQLVQSFIPAPDLDQNIHICYCGPPGFNESVRDILEELNYKKRSNIQILKSNELNERKKKVIYL